MVNPETKAPLDPLSMMLVTAHKIVEDLKDLTPHQQMCVMQAVVALLQQPPNPYAGLMGGYGTVTGTAAGIPWSQQQITFGTVK